MLCPFTIHDILKISLLFQNQVNICNNDTINDNDY